jgi:hypothetical protein
VEWRGLFCSSWRKDETERETKQTGWKRGRVGAGKVGMGDCVGYVCIWKKRIILSDAHSVMFLEEEVGASLGASIMVECK